MENPKSLHEGHRQRMLESYLSAGLDGFSDIQVLEFLLTFAVPRKDTNPLAHRLCDRFGSVYSVFEAPAIQLMQVKGVTQRVAALLSMQSKLWRRYADSRQKMTQIFSTTEACGDYLMTFFRGVREEQVWMMCLDAKCKLLDCRCISVGTVNSTGLPARKVVETALAVNATTVVLAHNHTSGIALPSKEDIRTTGMLKDALSCVDVFLADHIIVADDDYVSMRESSLL